jgi:glycosyltransferase involved in cell wall biosynthesis
MQTAPNALSLPDHVGPHLRRALRLAGEGDEAGALEAIAAAAISDIQTAQAEFLGDARAVRLFGEIAQAAIGRWIAAHERPRPMRAPRRSMRLLYVVAQVSEAHSPSRNLIRMVEWNARRHAEGAAEAGISVEPHVLVCDELTARNPPLRYLSFADAPSRRMAAASIARLEKSCPVKVLSSAGTYLDAAIEGLEHARALDPDVAFFAGSPACAVQTAIAAARVAPVQACISLGAPMLSRGIDAVVYNNPAKQTQDASFVRALDIELHGVATSGGDATVGAKIAPFPRKEMGLPDGVPVAVSISNVLVRRMLAGSFARDLAAFLRRNPDVWWLGIGFCDPAPFHRFLETVEGGEDIRRRCVFAGGWDVPWGMIKSCDVMLNEYPEGGGNTVIETMGCGIPVVAMNAGHRHAECIGAQLVGPDAIRTNDIDAYWRLAEAWIRDPAAAAAAGARQRDRARANFDYGVICDRYERIALDLCLRRSWNKSSVAEVAAAGA